VSLALIILTVALCATLILMGALHHAGTIAEREQAREQELDL
jgi:hypothetical protein